MIIISMWHIAGENVETMHIFYMREDARAMCVFKISNIQTSAVPGVRRVENVCVCAFAFIDRTHDSIRVRRLRTHSETVKNATFFYPRASRVCVRVCDE